LPTVDNANPELNSEGDSQIRENQLESDERARQDREEMFGDEASPESEVDPEVDPGTGSLDAAASDRQLADAVQTELDAQMPDNQLGVDANNGEGTITGEVISDAEMQQIEAIASQVEGVRSVSVQAATLTPGV